VITVCNGAITAEGKRIFGDFLKLTRGSKTQTEFAEEITEKTGVKISQSAYSYLERGLRDDHPLGVLHAIIRAEVLRHPNGKPYTMNDIVDVMSECLDPVTGQRKKHANGIR
jgi:transcriptional regulator with XRE-family HTH domain